MRGFDKKLKKNKKSNQISATLSTLNKMQCAKYNYNHCKMYNTKKKKKRLKQREEAIVTMYF